MGFTFNAIKYMPDDWFISNFDEEACEIIKIVRAEGRPPIPTKTYNKLMLESSRCCCICYNYGNGVILHHIHPWEDSTSHDEENLVVLCSNHHAEAHIGLTKENLLTDKLTPQKLKTFKDAWVKKVAEIAKNNVLKLMKETTDYWYYFHPGFLQWISNNKVDVTQADSYEILLKMGVISREGHLMPGINENIENSKLWISKDFGTAVHLRIYYASLMELVSQKIDFINLNNSWGNIEEVKNILEQNKSFIYQGKFNFGNDKSRTNKNQTGMERIRRGCIPNTKKYKNLSITFTYDEFFCMNSSAVSYHLSGTNKEIILIGVCRNIEVVDNKLIISPTVYAIGSGGSLKRPFEINDSNNI